MSLALGNGAIAFAQAPGQTGALGDAAKAHRRTERFLAGRSTASFRNGQPNSPGEALRRAQTAHAAMLQARSLRPAATLADLTVPWQPLGPVTVNSIAYGAISGRITSIALDSNDPSGNTVWLGTTGGGVWKSTNAAGPLAAATFSPLTDTLPAFSGNEGARTVPALSIGAVSVQPATTAIVLAGTGDPNDATDSYYGEGILRSADGGQTWTLIVGSRDGAAGNHSFSGLATAGFAWSTATPTLAVAAMSTSAEAGLVGASSVASVPGLYFSTDAGVTWAMATVRDGSQIVQIPQPISAVQAGNNATAVVWDGQRGLFIAALSAHGYYSSPDGATWTRLASQPGTGLTTANCPVGTGGSGSPNCPIFRGALAVQPVTGDLYAMTVDAYEGDQGLWQSLCNAGSSGSCATANPTFTARLDSGAYEVGGGVMGSSTAVSQGTYNLTLAAAPAAGNGTILLAGTIDLYRCSLSSGATACTLRNTTNAGNGCNATAAVAPAQHALTTIAQSSGFPLVFLGNDGGLWRSIDGVAETGPVCSSTDASHFDNLNPAIGVGGSLAEVVGFAQDSELTGTLLAGLGANGSAATANAGAMQAWPQMSAGEGGYPQLDPTTSNDWYIAIGAGVNLTLCDLGSACAPANFLHAATVGEPQVDEDAALLDAPTMLDPQATGNLLTATCRVWRGPARSGNLWSLSDALSPAMDGSAAPCSLTSAFVRSIGAGGPVATGDAAGHNGSEVLYAGMAGAEDGGGSLAGHVFVTTTGNTASGNQPWTDAANGTVLNSSALFNALGFDVSAVVADPHDATGATVYVTIMGFGEAGETPHVYRSTDFGAHWTDLSANLPDAPANSLVVDPNDANTVYVALDTGVYTTRTVSTCATQNCWSPLGSGLPNAPVTQLLAGAELPTGDGRLGMLRAATYGRGIWQTPLLSAISAEKPNLTANPTILTFASQPAATESPAQTITLTSSGNAPVTISSLVVSGDFVETDTCSGQTIAVGGTCAVAVQFAPTATGTRTGLLTVYADIAGGQVTVSLTGTATAPAAIVLTPLSLVFPSTTVNQTAPSQIVTVSNTGGTTASLQVPTISGDFAIQQNTCGTTLASQTGCSVVITFTPTASGTRSGVFTITDSEGTQTAQLSGVGQAPATDTLAPASLSFSQQMVGTISAPQQVTLTNAGDVPLTLISASVTSGDFAASNGCSNSLAPHSTCAISVTFVPTAVGNRTGTLTVSDQVRYQTVTLNGIGVAPPGVSLSPATINFADTGVGLDSPTQTVTLTNNGGLPLTLSATKISGDFAVASSTCGASLDAGSACTFVVLFAPNAAGSRTGSLALTDNAPSGSQTVNFSGTGIDFNLVADGATSVTVPSGTSATFPLALSSLSGLAGNVALTCSGAPTTSTCTVSPATAALGGNVQVSVVVQTGMSKAALRPWSPWSQGRGRQLVFAGIPLLLFSWRRRGRVRDGVDRSIWQIAALFFALAAVASLAGCGSAREIPLSGSGSGSGTGSPVASTPTPPGTYAITVSGTTAGVSHAVNLTLIVE